MKLIHAVVGLTAVALIAGAAAMVRVNDPAKALIAESAKWQATVQQFEDRFHARPGDFAGATALWGVAGGNGHDEACSKVNSLEASDTRATCDGNGNGELHYQDGPIEGSAPEWFRAWQHMANAGLIPGLYSGTAFTYPRGTLPGYNVPSSYILKDAGYTLMSFYKVGHPMWFPGYYFGLALGYAFVNPVGLHVETRGPAMSAAVAMRLDTKIDDGTPDKGRVRSFRDLVDCIVKEPSERYRYRHEGAGGACGLFLSFEDPDMYQPVGGRKCVGACS